MANLKAQGLYDVADPDHDPESGDIYEQEPFKGKQSFVYSVLVTSLQTEKGRELVKEFEGDARSIILKLHHYHTKSNVAQHDIITLTTEITNLTLNDSWKGTVTQFLSHFKEKLRLLDSLVPVSDQLPETTRLTFLQRAVQQNHDLRQIHVMDSVWRFKTDSTEALTFDTYYNLLWDAAHQYDLHQTKKGPQRKAFSSQQEEFNDDDEYANAEEQFSTDPEPLEHSPYSVYQSSFHPKMPQKSFLPRHIWETLSESTKQMIIEHNKKVKLNNPTPYPSGSKTKPNPTLVSLPLLQNKFINIHKMNLQKNHLLTLLPRLWRISAWLKVALTLQTFKMLCQCLMQKGIFHPTTLPDKYKLIKDMYLQGSANPITTLLTGEPMEA